MKNKFKIMILAVVFILPTIFLFSACGDKNTTKKDRTNTAEIVRVYQDYGANLYAEMTGFEHDEYELTGSSRNNLTLEFSINNGEWFECYPVQDFYDESGKGVYQILTATYNYGDSEVSSFTIMMTGKNVEPGEISISARIPESNTYNASAGTSPTTYTLKSKIQTIDDKIDGVIIYGFGSKGNSNSPEEEKFVFCQDSANPYDIKVGKFYSQANESGESISYDYFVRELTAEEETQFSQFNLEYKVVNYTPKYITTVSTEGSEDENIDTWAIESDENDAVYSTEGWTDSLNLSESNLWTCKTTETGFKNKKYVIFLVRLKATDDTVQSRAICFEVYIGGEEITQ